MRRSDRAYLLQDAELIRASPALDHHGVRVEAGDLEATSADSASGGGDTEEVAAMGSCDGVSEGDVFVIGDHLLHIDGEVGKGFDHLFKERDVARGAFDLSGCGIVVDAVRRDELFHVGEVIGINGFSEAFLCGDVIGFAHVRLDADGPERMEDCRRRE